MNENEKIIDEQIIEEVVETEEVEESTSINPRAVKNVLVQLRETIDVTEAIWNEGSNMFDVQESHMKELHVFNENNYTAKPEGLSEEEDNNWDYHNGLDKLTFDDVTRIFGESHIIIDASDPDASVKNVKEIAGNFLSMIRYKREYIEVERMWAKYNKDTAEEQIVKLRKAIDESDDPSEKERIQAVIDNHYDRLYLNFLADPMSDEDKNRIVSAFSDVKKVSYWLDRAKDKMESFNASNQFFLLISNIEKHYLPEEYHVQSNALMLYFLQMIVFRTNMNMSKDPSILRLGAMIIAITDLRQNNLDDDVREKILANIKAYNDQLLGLINPDNTVLLQSKHVADSIAETVIEPVEEELQEPEEYIEYTDA